MLQNAYFLAKIGADTAENERKFAETLPKIGNYPHGSGSPPSEEPPTSDAAAAAEVPPGFPEIPSATNSTLEQGFGEAFTDFGSI